MTFFFCLALFSWLLLAFEQVKETLLLIFIAYFSPIVWSRPAQKIMSTQLLQLELLQASWNLKWFTNQEWLSPEFCQVNHSPGSLILHCKLILFRNSWSLSLIYVTLLVVHASSSSHFTEPSLVKLSVCKNVFDKISYGKHHDLTKS